MTRIQKVQEKIAELGLQAFFILSKTNRFYLSGFTGSKGILVVTQKSAQLFVDDRYYLRAKKESDVSVQNLKNLGTYLVKNKFRKVAIEDSTTLYDFQKLEKLLPKSKWEITSDLVEDVRAQKTATELNYIRKGSKIIDATFLHIRKLLVSKKNFTEIDIAQEIERFGKKLGADELAFDSIVAFGPNAAIPHHATSTKKIGKNNFLLLDFGFKILGYHSDFTRTLFIGKLNKIQEKTYNMVLNAQLLGLKSVKIGKKAEDVHETVFNYFKQKKNSRYFTHNTGHGVGLEIHESPNFAFGSRDKLLKNSVITVEPGVYLPYKFGVRIEDMVLVKEKPEIFSKAPKDLQDMII